MILRYRKQTLELIVWFLEQSSRNAATTGFSSVELVATFELHISNLSFKYVCLVDCHHTPDVVVWQAIP